MRTPTGAASARQGVAALCVLAFVPAVSAADGSSLYKASCAICHADVQAPKFVGRSADDVKRTIAEGKGRMAPVRLQAADADAIASFTAAPPTLAPVPGPNPAALQKIASGDQAAAAKENRSALYEYLDAVYLDPRSAQARLRLAAQYVRMGYPERARDQWEIALALDPGNAEAAQNLREARPVQRGP